MERFPYWYHKIELEPGLVTPGFDMEPLWDNIRKVRERLNYRGRRVLDIAAFDGMFSFEAEREGAKSVIAADCLYRSFANFMFCREVLQSGVIPYYNVSPYNLADRMDVYLGENYDDERPNERLFDIVQHFGLLYHLRDPLLSLSQARSVMRTGGHLIIETDVVLGSEASYLLNNGLPYAARARDNYSVWWIPTKQCLFEMLESSFFQVDRASYSEISFDTPNRPAGSVTGTQASGQIGRACVIAMAVNKTGNEKFDREMRRTYRNPGLDLSRL